MCDNHGPNMDRRQFLTTCMKGAGAIAAATLLSPLETLAQDAKAEEVLKSNFATPWTIVVLPECFTDKERKNYDTEVDKFAKALDTINAYKEIKPWLRILKIWTPSKGKYNGDGSGAFGVKLDDKWKAPSIVDEAKVKEMVEQAKADYPFILINDATAKGYGMRERGVAPTNPETQMHEFGHGFCLGDEYLDSGFGALGAINVGNDKNNLPWKELEAKKVKGIETSKIPGYECWRGEKDDCLMKTVQAGKQLGPICYGAVITHSREKMPIVEKATSQEETISIKKGALTGIEATVIPSATFVPACQAYQATGSAEQMDELAKKAKEEFDPATIGREFKKATAKYDAKKGIYSHTDKLAAGEHLVVAQVRDSNAGILLDPKKVTIRTLTYRVSVAEK